MHFHAGLLDGHVWLQTGNHAVVEVAHVLLPVIVAPGNGQKHIRRIAIKSRSSYRKRKRQRHDADDGIGSTVEKNFAAERSLWRAERTLSQSIGKECNSLRVFVFFLRKCPADSGWDSQDLKQRSG